MNGENFWAKEYGVAFTRNGNALDENVNHEHPGDCIGDIGAAFVLVNIGIAATGLRKKYIEGPVLVYGSSDKAHRGALVME